MKRMKSLLTVFLLCCLFLLCPSASVAETPLEQTRTILEEMNLDFNEYDDGLMVVILGKAWVAYFSKDDANHLYCNITLMITDLTEADKIQLCNDLNKFYSQYRRSKVTVLPTDDMLRAYGTLNWNENPSENEIRSFIEDMFNAAEELISVFM